MSNRTTVRLGRYPGLRYGRRWWVELADWGVFSRYEDEPVGWRPGPGPMGGYWRGTRALSHDRI